MRDETMMARNFQIITLCIFLLGTSLFCMACEEKMPAPSKIEDVTMETGEGTGEIVIFARFRDEKGRSIITRGTLSIQMFQEGKKFFEGSVQVDPKEFTPYGLIGVYQFKSDPILTNRFLFRPKPNEVGWFDHTLKAQFVYENRPPIEFTGGYSFKEKMRRKSDS